MADRYWVGGTATWDGTVGTKWATTSGGAGGASVPTIADDVFFDASSGANTVTITGVAVNAKSINCTGFTGTITGVSGITVAGSITLVAGQTYTHTGTVTLTGTGTLTTAGKTFSGVTVNGAGITVTLGDALTLASRSLTISQGTFDTSASNYSVSAQNISSSSGTRTITLNGSTVTLVGSFATLNFGIGTNLTFNAGTSTINCTGSNAQFDGGGKTFNDVSFTSTSAGTRTITGANTFNNLSLTASGLGLSQLSLAANQTVNGTFTCAGSSATNRGFVRSDLADTQRTITATSVAALSDVDFRNITAAGASASSPWSGTRIGNCGGNSNITFAAPRTVYWVSAASANWNAAAWSTISGNTGGTTTDFPLAQDSIIIDNAGLTAGNTITINAAYNIGNLSFASRSNACTLSATVNGSVLYADLTLSSAVTTTGSSTVRFNSALNSTQTLTTAGVVVSFFMAIDGPNTFQFADNYTGTSSVSANGGTITTNNHNITCSTFASNTSNIRTLNLGSSLITCTGTGNVWFFGSTGTLTFNKGTSTIVLSDTSETARTFSGAGLTYNSLTIGGSTGTSTLTITGANTFDTLASTKTVAHTIVFPNSTTTVKNWAITGTAGNVVTLTRTGASGTFTLAKSGGGVVSGVDYLSISNSTASPANTWYAGVNSTNGGGNTDWAFSNYGGAFFALF